MKQAWTDNVKNCRTRNGMTLDQALL